MAGTRAQRHKSQPLLRWRRKGASGQIPYSDTWSVFFDDRVIYRGARKATETRAVFRVEANMEGEWAVSVSRGTASLQDMLAALRAWKAAQKAELEALIRHGTEAAALLHDGLIPEHTSHVEGTLKRMRNAREHPLICYRQAGRVSEAQYLAGEAYEADYECVHREGRDETRSHAAASGGGTQEFMPVSQRQADAMKRLSAIDARLSREDASIVRMVCGEGHWATLAVKRATGRGSATNALKRFRAAMENLLNASEDARATGWRVSAA